MEHEVRMKMEEELSELVKKLGCGGWRIEKGIMPLIVLTQTEAERILHRLDEAERNKS